MASAMSRSAFDSFFISIALSWVWAKIEVTALVIRRQNVKSSHVITAIRPNPQPSGLIDLFNPALEGNRISPSQWPKRFAQ
jgi:hypothetical protein